MKGCKLLSGGTAAFVFFLPLPCQAFECPKHLIEAKVAIQIVAERIAPKNMAARVALSDSKISTARNLLTNARITLLAARMFTTMRRRRLVMHGRLPKPMRQKDSC